MPAKDTIPYVAAKYFGVHKEPRTSVKVGRRQALIVANRGGRTVLMSYDDDATGVKGFYLPLTDRMRDELIEALDWTGQAEREDQADALKPNQEPS